MSNKDDVSMFDSALDEKGLDDTLNNKTESLSGEHAEEMVESLSPNVTERVEVLREIQSQRDELEAKFLKDIAALEAKYQQVVSTSIRRASVVEAESAAANLPQCLSSKCIYIVCLFCISLVILTLGHLVFANILPKM
ncbi:hypothetical protein M0R45_007846 [Rubus argutus]|uniref:Uncharacterized protein n=1 Tax=Rubus argutus TaxID=59490 RepID=A0AAW1Y2F6_RUBAR